MPVAPSVARSAGFSAAGCIFPLPAPASPSAGVSARSVRLFLCWYNTNKKKEACPCGGASAGSALFIEKSSRLH